MQPTHRLVLAALVSLALPIKAAAQTQSEIPEPAAAEVSSAAGPALAFTGRSITAPAGTATLAAGPLSNLDLAVTGVEAGINQIFLQDVEVCFFGSCSTVELADPLFILIGGSYAIQDDLEVGAFLLNVELAPDVEYRDPAIWGRYRILNGDIEVGVQLLTWFPVSRADLTFEVGVPVRFHGPVRFDTGLFFSLDTSGDGGLRIPATVTTNVTEQIFLGGRSGLGLPKFDSDGMFFPLEFVAGYTVGAPSKPLADITLMAGFPYFIVIGGRLSYDEVVTEVFQVAVGANVFFDI